MNGSPPTPAAGWIAFYGPDGDILPQRERAEAKVDVELNYRIRPWQQHGNRIRLDQTRPGQTRT
jgi:hypothetical protein